MHRMSLAEIIVPYGDPRAPFNRKCAYDVVDYGMGNCCSSLDLGCDCLGVIKYFDAVLCDKKGIVTSPSPFICMQQSLLQDCAFLVSPASLYTASETLGVVY